MGSIKVLILFVLEIVLVYCQTGDDFKLLQRLVKRGNGNRFSDEDAKAIVERHNFYRSNTKPSASNMKYMVRNIRF